MLPEFRIGDFAIHMWSLMAVLGFAASVVLVKRAGARNAIALRHIAAGVFFNVVGAIVGGRIVYVLVHLGAFRDNWLGALAFWEGGLFSYGCLAGATAGVALYALAARQPFGRMLDLVGMGALTAMGVGRIGCLLAGCDYGKPTSVPWAVTFTDPLSLVPPELRGVPLHPTQAYLALIDLAVVAVAYALHRRGAAPGRAFGVTAVGFAVLRFIVEFYRGDADRGLIGDGGFSWGQVFCVLWLALGALALATAGRGPWRKNELGATRRESQNRS